MKRINFNKNGVSGIEEIINQDLKFYCREGLRTLVMTNRVI